MKLSFWQLFVAGSLIMTSCSDGNDNSSDNPINPPANARQYVTFDPSVNAPSRATDTSFETGDAIGVFAVKSTGNDTKGIIADNGNYADNVKYVYSDTKFSPSGTGIAYSEEGTKFYYHAVYPYTSSIKNKFTFSVKNNQNAHADYTASDLLTAHTSATNEKLVALKFSHRLVKVVIDLSGEEWPSSDATVTFKNVYTDVSVDLNTMSFTATGNKGDVVCSSNGNKSFKLILPPQKIAKGTEIANISIGGKNYPVTSSSDADISSGSQIGFTFIMKNQEVVEFTGDINPWNTPDKIDDIVPDYIQEKMKSYITIYRGVNPPIVEGAYLASKFETVYCEDAGSGGYETGRIISDLYFRFSNQNTSNNTLDYEEKQNDLNSQGKGAFISGSDDNFTAFFNTSGTSQGISTKTALVISGTKTSSGIKDMHYAFIMIEKGSDPDNLLMKEGVFRVFKDADGLAANTTWSRAIPSVKNGSIEWTITSNSHQ